MLTVVVGAGVIVKGSFRGVRVGGTAVEGKIGSPLFSMMGGEASEKSMVSGAGSSSSSGMTWGVSVKLAAKAENAW